MPAAPVTSVASRTSWQTVVVSLVILAIQAVLLDRLVGEELLSIPLALFGRRFLRKEVLLVVLAAAAVLQGHVRRHLAAYEFAPLSVPRLVWQGVAFGALFGFLLAMQAGFPQPLLGDMPTQAVAGLLTLAWIASMVLLLPPGTDAGPMVAGASFAAAVVAVGVGITDIVTETFWRVTGGTTVAMVESMLTPFAGGPVVRPEKFVIGTKDFQVNIHGGCSGYQGIFLITMLFAAYLWWFRRLHRFPQSFLLFPLGIGLIFLSNAVRITALILVGIWISPTIAEDGFHSQAGWIMFLLVGLGLIWFASRMPFFTVAPADDDVAPAADDPHFAMLAGASGASGAFGSATAAFGSATGAFGSATGASGSGAAASGSATAAFGSGAATGAARSSPAAPGAMCGPSVPACLAPFLALLATTILAGAFSTKDGIDILYPLRVVVVAVVLWRLRHEFRWREATLSPVAVALGAATCLLWMLLAPAIMLPDPQEAARQDPAQLGMVGGSVWLLFRFIGYTITVPIAEELAFRGFLARRLISEQVERVPLGTFTWLSFLGSSLAFGLLHGGAWLPGTLAGMAFLLALYHRRQIVDAIVAHATTNALIGFYAIATNAWAALG